MVDRNDFGEVRSILQKDNLTLEGKVRKLVGHIKNKNKDIDEELIHYTITIAYFEQHGKTQTLEDLFFYQAEVFHTVAHHIYTLVQTWQNSKIANKQLKYLQRAKEYIESAQINLAQSSQEENEYLKNNIKNTALNIAKQAKKTSEKEHYTSEQKKPWLRLLEDMITLVEDTWHTVISWYRDEALSKVGRILERSDRERIRYDEIVESYQAAIHLYERTKKSKKVPQKVGQKYEEDLYLEIKGILDETAEKFLEVSNRHTSDSFQSRQDVKWDRNYLLQLYDLWHHLQRDVWNKLPKEYRDKHTLEHIRDMEKVNKMYHNPRGK